MYNPDVGVVLPFNHFHFVFLQVTPGKSLNELQVLFMGHECFEALTGQEIQAIYEQVKILSVF